MSTEFAEQISEMIEKSKEYSRCMALQTSRDGQSVELILDTSDNTYGEHIEGEGADISLIRCRDTDRVVGVRLPMRLTNLCVYHDGPIRINEGFRKEEMQ